MSLQARLSEYTALTPVLMDFGWFVAPFINGAEHDSVKRLVDEIQRDPPRDAAARRAYEDRIHKEFMDVAFSFQARARYVWLALRTPVIQSYSHLYECAVFAYYKREYAAAVCLLLVALEGILLALNGWRAGDPNKPKFKALKHTIKRLPLANINADMNAVQEAYRDALDQFISRWLYAHTENADLTLSVLNRHYVLHGMDGGNFYRPHDIHRLLLGFDLVIDLIAMTKGTWRPIVEVDLDRYEERLTFYADICKGVLPIGLVTDRERELLKQHPNYVSPVLEACEELRLR